MLMTPQISNFSPNLALECQDPYPNNLLDISTQMSNWCFKQNMGKAELLIPLPQPSNLLPQFPLIL